MEVAASLIAIVDLSVSVSSACIKYIRGVSNAVDEAAALHEELSCLLSIVSRLQLPSVSSSLKIELEPDIKLCHDDLVALQKKLVPAEGFRGVRQRLVWPFKKAGEFQNVSVRIQRHLNIFEKAIAVSTLEITAEIKAQLLDLREARETDRAIIEDNFEVIGAQLSDIKKGMDDDQRKELVKWLNAADCESNYRDNVALAASNTGSWFFQATSAFAQWLGCGTNSPKHVLVQGEAGAGKTVLMSSAVRTALSTDYSRSAKIYVGYYYFDFRSSHKSLPRSMLLSLLYQLINDMSSFPEAIERLRSKYPTTDLVPLSELTSILLQEYSDYDVVFLFIDALDECEKVDELLRVLQNLTRNAGCSADLRFMCFSRDESGIKQSLEPSGFFVQPLEYASVVQDIEVYVTETIRNDPDGKFRVFRGFPEQLRGDVITTLVQRSGGMFRWVQCQLDEISRCRTAREIREAINNLPSTLTETYERIFMRMSQSDLCKARRILSWLIGTDGEISAIMLVEALTIDDQMLQVDEEDRLQNPGEIRDICRSLVRETNNDTYPYLRPYRKVIKLAHFSVTQYLLSPQAGKFRLDLRDIHLQLARACLAYSTSPIWESIMQPTSEDDRETETLTEVVQFLAFTCGDIFSHLQYQNVEYELVNCIIGLLQQDSKLKNLHRNCALLNHDLLYDVVLDIDARGGPWGIPMTRLLDGPLRLGHSSTFLSKCIVAGLYPTCISLIESAIDVSGFDNYHQSPLAFIVATGRIDLVRRSRIQNKESYQRGSTGDGPGGMNALESILKSTVNGLFTAIVAKWVDGCHELFAAAVDCLDLLPDPDLRKKVYPMMIRLCAILGAVEGLDDFLVSLRSHASSSELMDAQELRQLEEEILCASVRHGNADCIQTMLAAGVSPTARINRASNMRLLNQRYGHDVTLEEVNKYWLCHLDSELLLKRIDSDDSRNWEYTEEEPKIIATTAMDNARISRLLIQGCHQEMLRDEDILLPAISSWLPILDPEKQTDDLQFLQDLLYDYLQRPENKEMLNLALNICAGSNTGIQVIQRLISIGADPNNSPLGENHHGLGTPLVAACQGGCFANIAILLAAGADPNVETESGMLPSVALAANGRFSGTRLEGFFDAFKQRRPELKTSITKPLSPPPAFNRSGLRSRGGSVISAFITFPGASRHNLPVDFLRSRGLLENLDRYLPGDEYGTPLIAAAATGNEPAVDLLMENGATVKAPGHPDTEWSHPALAAILAEHWNLAMRFLEDLNAPPLRAPQERRKWAMSLMFSLRHDSQDVALKLIEAGVDVDFAMDQGASSYLLYDTRESFHTDMDEINTILSDIGTPMSAACVGGNLTLINKLQSIGTSQDLPTGASFGDFLTAVCASEKVEAVGKFLEKGHDVNKCSPGRETWCPLIAAVQISYSSAAEETVSLLIRKGAKANVSYPFRNAAAELRSLESLLFEHGKSLHFSLMWKRMWDDCRITGPSILYAKPFFGNSIIAATQGREDMVKLIAGEEGVDVNHEQSCGIYPTAMMATLDMKKSYRVSDPLRELGAVEISASQILNFTHPFRALTSDLVKENVSLTIPGTFWGNMITVCVSLPMAIPFLLQHGAGPTEVVPGSFYGSALIAASALLCADTILYFLDHGCDINEIVPDSPFGTPLIAVCAGPAHYPFQWSFHDEYNLQDPPGWSMVQYDMLELLTDKGADVNATHNEFSPLIALVLCDCEEKYKIKGLKLLLEKGADPNLTLPMWGFDGVHPGKTWSAVSIAERKGEATVKEALIKGRQSS